MSIYIVIAPASISTVDFIPRNDGTYSVAKFWPDIEFLDSLLVTNDFKLFAHQETKIGSAIPSVGKLFVCTRIQAMSRQEAVEQGLDAIRTMLLVVGSRINFGIRIHHDEIVISDITARPQFQIANLSLELKNGGIDSFTTMNDGKFNRAGPYVAGEATQTKLRYRFDCSITHDDYQPLFVYVNNANFNSSEINCAGRLIPRSFRLEIQQELLDQPMKRLIATIYNEAITTYDLISSFLLFWQILEIVESSVQGTPILDEEAINAVAKALTEQGLSKEIINERVLMALRSIRKPSQPQRIIDGIRQLAPSYNIASDLITVIVEARKMRGTLIHPVKRPNVYSQKLHSNYMKLRVLVSGFVSSLLS